MVCFHGLKNDMLEMLDMLDMLDMLHILDIPGHLFINTYMLLTLAGSVCYCLHSACTCIQPGGNIYQRWQTEPSHTRDLQGGLRETQTTAHVYRFTL